MYGVFINSVNYGNLYSYKYTYVYSWRHPPCPHLVIDVPQLILATLGNLGMRLGIFVTRHPTLVTLLSL